MNWLTTTADGMTISLRIVPRASKNEISGVIDDTLKIRLQAPPVESKANKALIKFLAKKLDTPKRNITILSGNTSRNKCVLIKDVSEKDVTESLQK